MKYKLVMIMLCVGLLSTFAQEQFYGKQNGLSGSFSRGIMANDQRINASGLSFYSKTGLAIVAGINWNDRTNYPVASLSYFIKSSHEKKFASLSMGLTYADGKYADVYGANLTAFIYLFKDTDSPGTFSGTYIIQSPYQSGKFDDFYPGMNIGYTQAFSINERVYPVIGVSGTYEFDEESFMAIISFGVNFKI